MPTLTAKRIVKYGTLILVTCGFITYIGIQSATYLKGPQLTLTSPLDGESTTEELITITGSAQNVSFIQMNGNQIFSNTEGNFSEKLLLNPGYNIITVNVTDRFERSLSKEVHITYLAEEKTRTDYRVGTSSPLLDIPDTSTATTSDVITE